MSDPSDVGREGSREVTGTVQRSTDWDTVTRRYRRGVGGWWWLALLLVPLLLALAGLGFDRGPSTDLAAGTPSGSATASGQATGANAALPAAFSVTKSADSVTVKAQVPDEAAKTELLDAVKASAGGATVVDEVTVTPGAVGPDPKALAGALGATEGMSDAGLALEGSTLALTGTAPDEAAKAALETAAKAAVPGANVDNQVAIGDGAGAQAGSPFAITRSGDSVTVEAQVADEAAKTALLDAVKAAGVGTVVDKVSVVAGAAGPDPAAIGSLLGASGDVDNIGIAGDGKALTLTGDAPSEAVKTAAGEAAAKAYPNATVTNNLAVEEGSGAPAPAPAAGCDALQASIGSITKKAPIAFNPGSSRLTSASAKMLKAVAAKTKPCTTARLTIAGHTDITAPGDGKALSLRRANAVRAALVANGVPWGQVRTVGFGETKPIASNRTPEGMAKNRRVEITVN